MEYGYEKVLMVQRRCGVSFEEADKALKQTKGDVDKACTYAIRKKNQDNSWSKKVLSALNNFVTYRIKINKNGETRFNIPMGIIIVIIFLYLIVVSTSYYYRNSGMGFILFCVFAIVVLTGHTLEITPGEKKQEQKLEKVNSNIIVEEEVLEVFAEDEVHEDDEYNTIEIE
ncbi:MAG: hypothetical protein KAQ68_01355 [Clostridiales bacterium]|nr:hypothetical protein [Clostridiales bacterium]